MNGSNGFYGNVYSKNDGTALNDQFWPHSMNEPTLSSTAMSSGINAGSNSNNGSNTFNSGTAGPATLANNVPVVGLPGGAGYFPLLSDARQYPQGQQQFSTSAPQSAGGKPNQALLGSRSNPSSPQYPAGNGHSKKRVARACDHCRRRKIKCDAINPQSNKCTNCTKYNAECRFTKLRDDIEKKRNTPEFLEKLGSASDDMNVLNFVPVNSIASNPALSSIPVGPANNENNHNDSTFANVNTGLDTRDRTGRNGELTKPLNAINGKVEKLDRKVSMIVNNLAKLEWLIDKMVTDYGDTTENRKGLPKPKAKNYCTALLTFQTMAWVKCKLNPSETNEKFMTPLRDLLTVSVKWYIIKTKEITDFSSLISKEGRYTLYPLPPSGQAKRIVENFRASIAISSTPGLLGLDYYLSLIDKYYEPDAPPLSYAELLLLNVSLCSGASRMRLFISGDSYRLRKDRYNPSREELKNIENDTLLNAIYFYNKVAIAGGGTVEIQALLILSLYLQENINTELSSSVLATAIRFAMDLGLNQDSSYENLNLEEEILMRSLWWHCFNRDKWFALILSRPPMIRDQDMDMLTDQNYYDYIKKLLSANRFKYGEEVDKIANLEMALDYMVNYCEFLPTFLSYFIQKLVRLESKMIECCFSTRSILDYSFDEVLDRVLVIRKDLRDWDENLHPCMRLDSYRQYVSLLYVHHGVENPALTYEIACSRIVGCHFRNLHMKVLLSMFAVSFLVDNLDQFKSSRHTIPKIYRMFIDEGIENSMKMLKIFQTVDYDRHMYNDILYLFLTGVFALLLYTARHMDEDDNQRIPSIIQLLIIDHAILVGENQECLVSDNIKWNTSVFFYTFLLAKIVENFNKNSPHAKNYDFDSERYASMLEKILVHSTKVKNDSIDRLVACMEKSPLTETDLQATKHSQKADPSQFAPSKSVQLLPLSQTMYSDIDEETMDYLRSSRPFNRVRGDLKTKFRRDTSLFPTSYSNFSTVYDAYTSGTFGPSPAYAEPTIPKPQPQNEAADEALSGIRSFFCLDELLYDRDFTFSKACNGPIFQKL